MNLFKRSCQILGIAVLGAVLSAQASGAVVTRVVAAGGAGTAATIAPGDTVSIDIRLDIGALQAKGTGITGAAFKISQTAPPAGGFFSITKRSFAGSPFTDVSSGITDAVVLAPPGNALSPANRENLGRSTVSPAVVRPAANVLLVSLSLTASAKTPPGTYRINVTPGVSFAADDAFNDYDLSTGAPFTITVAPPR